MTQAKRRGAQAEIWPVEHARKVHGLQAEPIRKAGALDQGDHYVKLDRPEWAQWAVFEDKARRKLDIGKALREAQIEALNFQDARGLFHTPRSFVLARPIGLGEKQVGKWWVIQTYDQLLHYG